MTVRKSHRTRVPFSDAWMRVAIDLAVVLPSAIAVNKSSSIAPRNAAVR